MGDENVTPLRATAGYITWKGAISYLVASASVFLSVFVWSYNAQQHRDDAQQSDINRIKERLRIIEITSGQTKASCLTVEQFNSYAERRNSELSRFRERISSDNPPKWFYDKVKEQGERIRAIESAVYPKRK